MNIKTPSDLKYAYELNNPNGHFFDRKTMKFFGDTMTNYGLCKAPVAVSRYTRAGAYLGKGLYRKVENVVCLHRKRPVNGNLQSSTYFELPACESSSSHESWDDAKHREGRVFDTRKEALKELRERPLACVYYMGEDGRIRDVIRWNGRIRTVLHDKKIKAR